ncbi:MAG TPA: energy transducer TonB [Acidobacteriaceae bacterium]|nr:energy transducer TonB [Acidobacteriaceae bacterium]
MRLAWVAAFVLPVLCTPLSHPQQDSYPVTPPNSSSSSTKAATAQTTAPPASAQADSASPDSAVVDPGTGPITEEELRQALVGKHFFLRGLWLSDDLHFGLAGALLSQSPRGSFTLCDMEIDKVRLTKNRLELDGARYGIHFEDEGDWSQQASAFDRIRITPKKKRLVIIIDRQVVISPKKQKKHARRNQVSQPSQPAQPQPAAASAQSNSAAPDAETTHPAASAALLRANLDRIFALSLDARMIAAMPDYWQYFYNAQRKHQSIEPTDPNIVHPGAAGVTGPTLVHNIVPATNDYAQRAQVAGVASYKVILGADGKPMAVAVYRPIGFGLDENAVAAIRHATFAPAHRDGKAVASVIDMAVVFRILSPLTERAAAPETTRLPANVSPVTGKPSLPGPYSEAQQPPQ